MAVIKEQEREMRNPFRLSKEELQVLRLWQSGKSMKDAYCEIFKPDPNTKEQTIRKRIKRFFDTYRMREAMANSPGPRGLRAKAEFEKWKLSSSTEPLRNIRDNEVKRKLRLDPDKDTLTDEDVEKIKQKDDKTLWLESLNISQTPASLTVYGTGQFLCYVAVKEIMDRQKEIKAKGLSALEKSALTPTIISAIKTAAAMILPYAPAPTDDERKQMSKAAILLGLFPDDIAENPDDFTAPPPATVDIEPGKTE